MINNDNRYKGVIATQLPEKDKTINILLQGNHYEALSIKDGKYLHLPEDIKSNKREKEKENTRKKIHQEKSDRKLVGELQLEEDMKFAKFLENVENRGGTRKKSKRKSKRKRLQRRATWKGKYR